MIFSFLLFTKLYAPVRCSSSSDPFVISVQSCKDFLSAANATINIGETRKST